ncbi:MAG: LysR family transcriptional regulator [Actinomycetota bacterium]
MALPPTTPELVSLDLFVSVVELGSLSKAATAHQLAQPSVSARIRSLEQQLGVKLLERTPTGSVPTETGALVAGWAENVLRAASELNAGVAALKARRATPLRVVASYTIAEYLLPRLLEQFLRNRPAATIRLDVANSSAVLAALKEGRADLGFIESPAPTPTMREQVLMIDELIPVVGVGHPLADAGPVPIEDFAATPLTMREPGSGTRESLEAALVERGFDPPPSALELGSTAAIRAAVIGGGAPAVLSSLALAADLDAGSLFRVDVTGLRIERRLRAVWPGAAEPSPLAVALLDHLRLPDGQGPGGVGR